MTKRILFSLLAVVVALGSELAGAQKSPPSAPDLKPAASPSLPSQLTEPILERIENIEEKMVTVAEDFPDACTPPIAPGEIKMYAPRLKSFCTSQA